MTRQRQYDGAAFSLSGRGAPDQMHPAVSPRNGRTSLAPRRACSAPPGRARALCVAKRDKRNKRDTLWIVPFPIKLTPSSRQRGRRANPVGRMHLALAG